MHDSFIGFLEKWVRSFAYERLRNDELQYISAEGLRFRHSNTYPIMASEDTFH